jgi:hypothetical protein
MYLILRQRGETGISRKYCDMTPEGWKSGAGGDDIAIQQLGKQILAATDMQVTIQDLLITMFSVQSVSRTVKRRLYVCCSTVIL